MQHFKPTCAIPLGDVTAYVPEAKLYQRTRRGQRLSHSIMSDLAAVAIARHQGFPDLASTVLSGMEARLGVTEHDRVAAMVGGADVVEGAFIPLTDAPERLNRLRAALSERASREKPLAVQRLLQAARERRGQDLRTASLLRAVDMKQAELDGARTAKAKREARKGLNRAISALWDHVDAGWLEEVDREGVELAKLRGEALEDVETEVADWLVDPLTGVPVRDRKTKEPILLTERATARRVDSRNGLMKAFETGALDGAWRGIRAEKLLRAGIRYQQAYEIAEGKSSPSRELGVPTMKRCKPSAGPQSHILEAAESLALMRGTDTGVVARLGLSLLPLQRAILDAVCGEDLAVSAAADRARRSHDDAKRALRDGLEVVCVNMGWC